MASQRLAGKVAVVTGGGSGIGRAIAHRFATEGASCVVVGRTAKKLEEAVQSLPRPDKQSFHVGDVTDPGFWDNVSLAYRDMDILVNAAGISQSKLLVRTQGHDIEKILATNLTGTILGCKTAATAMMKHRRGCIINISSLLAVKGGPGAAVYAASKAGVLGLTRSLAAEIGRRGIRVNAILPGYIDQTDMTPDFGEEKAKASIPLGRLGLPEEVADAAVFLAANEYANNCILNLDGGLSAM